MYSYLMRGRGRNGRRKGEEGGDGEDDGGDLVVKRAGENMWSQRRVKKKRKVEQQF